jgi:hypothetical protein
MGEAITQVKSILREQFRLIPQEEIEELSEKLRNPVAYQWRDIMHVAEDKLLHVKEFSIMAQAPDPRFCFLDYIAAAKASPHSKRTSWIEKASSYEGSDERKIRRPRKEGDLKAKPRFFLRVARPLCRCGIAPPPCNVE